LLCVGKNGLALATKRDRVHDPIHFVDPFEVCFDHLDGGDLPCLQLFGELGGRSGDERVEHPGSIAA